MFLIISFTLSHVAFELELHNMNIKKIVLITLLTIGSISSAYAHDSFGLNINLGNPYFYYPSQQVYYNPPPVCIDEPRIVYHHPRVEHYSYDDSQPYYQDEERHYSHEHEHRHHRDDNEGDN
jgi:hypothetical protein